MGKSWLGWLSVVGWVATVGHSQCVIVQRGPPDHVTHKSPPTPEDRRPDRRTAGSTHVSRQTRARQHHTERTAVWCRWTQALWSRTDRLVCTTAATVCTPAEELPRKTSSMFYRITHAHTHTHTHTHAQQLAAHQYNGQSHNVQQYIHRPTTVSHSPKSFVFTDIDVKYILLFIACKIFYVVHIWCCCYCCSYIIYT